MFGSVPPDRASLACLGCPCFGWPLHVRFLRCFLFVKMRNSSLSLLLFRVVLVGLSTCFCLPSWLGCLRFGPLPPGSLPLPFPLGCLLVSSGPVSCLLVTPTGYLVVSATVRLPYLWHRVSWVFGSCLHSASWQQRLRLRPCVGLCLLHHVVGAVHMLIALALRYLPLGEPEYP